MNVLPLNQHYIDWFSELIPEEFISRLKTDEDWIGIGLIEDDTACGALVAVVEEDYLELQYLMVAPDFRRRGMASAMMRWMGRRCAVRELPLVGHFDVTSQEDGLYLFFAELPDFSIAPTDEGTYVTSVQSLAAVAKLDNAESADSLPFDRMTSAQRKLIYQAADEAGFPFLRQYESRADALDHQLTRACFDEDGVCATVFFEKLDDGNLRLAFLYCRPDSRRTVISLLGKAAAMMQEPYGSCTLEVLPMSEESAGLVKKLMPDAKLTSTVYMLGQDIDQWLPELSNLKSLN